MEIPAHKKRFVLLAALEFYAKGLAKAKKASEDVHATTGDLDEKAIIVEILTGEYQEVQANLALEGTPLAGGDAASAEFYRDDDGTDLQTSALDEWLRMTAGAYVPVDVISSWTLDARKLVAAWLRAIEINVGEAMTLAAGEIQGSNDPAMDGKELEAKLVTLRPEIIKREQQQARVTAPEFFQLDWFTAPTLLQDLAWTDGDVDEWLEHGPWGVKSYAPDGIPANPASDEWVTVRTLEGAVVAESPKVFTGLQAARLAAAQANHMEHIEHLSAVRAAADDADAADAAAGGADAGTVSEEEEQLHPAEV